MRAISDQFSALKKTLKKIDRIYRITWIFLPFRKKGKNPIVQHVEALVPAGSGLILLRVLRSLSKLLINPVNPVG